MASLQVLGRGRRRPLPAETSSVCSSDIEHNDKELSAGGRQVKTRHRQAIGERHRCYQSIAANRWLTTSLLGYILALTIFGLICNIQLMADCRQSVSGTELKNHSAKKNNSDPDWQSRDGDALAKLAQLAQGKSNGGASKRKRSTRKPANIRPTDKIQAAQHAKRKKAAEAAREAVKALKAPGTSSRPKAVVEAAMRKLSKMGRKVEKKRNSTIIINGRKFDQLNPIECVDEQFYETLARDLNLIDSARTRDEYETYYDDERAKAISAIIDAHESSAAKTRGVVANILEEASGKKKNGTSAPASTSDGPNIAPLAELSSMAAVNMTSEGLLNEIKRYWNETYKRYTSAIRELNLRFSRRKRATATTKKPTKKKVASMIGSNRTSAKPAPAIQTPDQEGHAAQVAAAATARPTTTSKRPSPMLIPNYRRALENHNYLMQRLEDMKAMLLNGEEALIVLNNRVKKLQHAVGEEEIQRALCSCITSRGGRAALMLVSELFNDRNAMSMIKDYKSAREKAEAAAIDTAEFCSYWYGDTLRAQAIQKEKQIRRLILKIKKQVVRTNITTTTTKTSTSVRYVKIGNKIKKIVTRETRINVVTKMVEMTRLWLPSLSDWITNELGDDMKALLKGTPIGFSGKNFIITTKAPPAHAVRKRALDQDEINFSTPFDHANLYSDIDSGEDDGDDFGSRIILRGRRAIKPTSTRAPTTTSPSTTTTTTTTTKKSASTKKPAKKKGSARRNKPTTVNPTVYKKLNPDFRGNSSKPALNFEERTSESASKCAIDGFTALLEIALDENLILYETARIKRNDTYIKTLRDTWIQSFGKFWVLKRDEWSKKFQNMTMGKSTSGSAAGSAIANKTAGLNIDGKSRNGDPHSMFTENSMARKSVDELIDDALEPSGNAYDRGVRLGYTIGKFIGEKAARQWPDPAELNTFTYDSLFLAGVGHNHSAQDTKRLENLIVTETAKRIAFTEANRQAFAKALHTAYLNGAFIVPKFGVLHGQRAVAKRAAIEGSQIGYQAASIAAAEFAPRAVRFFRLHDHQRALAAPYKYSRLREEGADKKGLLGRLDEVRMESELNANISAITLQCGQRSGTLMGALMGLMIVPESFETYSRVRGSLEAVESEFYRYKLGALRGYELGESWAMLNYTNAIAKRTESLRADWGRVINTTARPVRLNKKHRKKDNATTTSTTTTKKPAKVIKLKDGRNKTITHIPDDQMFSTMYETDPKRTNVNNLFQYMVVNYGKGLLANHSRASMLTLRSLVAMDENMIVDIKKQAGDLVDTTTNTTGTDIDEDDVFETVKVAGELSGVLNSPNLKGKLFPIKFEIIDLGPLIEFADVSARDDSQKDKGRDRGFEVIPLSEALTKVNKIYMKLRVARHYNGSDQEVAGGDDLENYLNAEEYDSGDGFLCGSYSQLGANRRFGGVQQQARETQDELELEAFMLDELYDRIEHTPMNKSSVEMTEQAMKVTTVAPARLQAVKPTLIVPVNGTGQRKPDKKGPKSSPNKNKKIRLAKGAGEKKQLGKAKPRSSLGHDAESSTSENIKKEGEKNERTGSETSSVNDDTSSAAETSTTTSMPSDSDKSDEDN